MTLEILMVLQTATLIGVAGTLIAARRAVKIHTNLLLRILARSEEESNAVRLPAPVTSVPLPASLNPNIDPNIHEILNRRRADCPWESHGWVRAHTSAWQRILDTPNEALKIDGEIVEGVQDV